MSDELDVVLKSLRAARLANEASIHVIDAVVELLSGGTATPPVTATGEEVVDDGPPPCRHEGPIADTLQGSFLVCTKCDEQVSI